jgi:hypothetical protein
MFPLTRISREFTQFSADASTAMVASMRAIVKDSFERLSAVDASKPGYTVEKAKQALQRGVWASVDWVRAHSALNPRLLLPKFLLGIGKISISAG